MLMKRLIGLTCFSVLWIGGAPGAESNYVVPGENLVIEGLPKIPAALAEDLNR